MELKERRSSCDRDECCAGAFSSAKDRLMSGSLQKAAELIPGIGATCGKRHRRAAAWVGNFDQKLCGRSRAYHPGAAWSAPVFKEYFASRCFISLQQLWQSRSQICGSQAA